MQIPRSYLEAYNKALNAVSDQARKATLDALSQIDYSMPVADVRNAAVEIMQRTCGASATVSARIAADFYDGLRAEFEIDDDFTASIDSGRVPEATEGAVRAFAQDLVDGKPVEQFIGKCASRADYETRRAANKCVESNARSDPKKPRWARVPVGSETCEFYIMLASRGFVYHTEETASHAHANCDCRVVPSWDKKNPAVQGYDPNEYFDKWVESGFNPSKGGGGGETTRAAKDLGSGGKFANSGINGINAYLQDAKTVEELYERADEVLNEINERWNGDESMKRSATRTAKEMRDKLAKG